MFKSKTLYLSLFIAITVSFFTLKSSAHSEHDKARFVSPDGKDFGKCDNVLRPCKTIGYAVKQANKGDKVLVSGGEYRISSTEELFYLKSEIVPVVGGYNKFDHFQSQSPNSNSTTLIGVPSEMAESLSLKGFSIISDGKSLLNNAEFNQRISAYNMLSEKQTELDCVNNLAGSFECNNINLLAHMPLSDFSSSPGAASDIWGHVDLNTGDEYAIIGLSNGVSVVNVTNPTEPVEVGTIPGKTNIWRDIKVYQYFDDSLNLWRAYAYATLDGSNDNVTVVDLNNLPHSISLTQRNTAVAQAHNVYITNVDHSLNIALAGMTPSLQLIGAKTGNGQRKYGGAFHSYSLEDPENIAELGLSSSGSGYTHDGASLLITDDRTLNDCNSSDINCTVFVDFNEKEMNLWNISDSTNTKLLGSAEYDDVIKDFQYIHSGWASEDKQFIFLHDEFDEYKGGLNSTVRVFSISDLTNPVRVGTWQGQSKAIDHNGFVRGNRYYMSNYEKGLTILDITDPTTPIEVGFFDTFIPSNSPSFNGAWGAYPFLPSGNLIVSDINSGLYIVKDNTLTTAQGHLSFTVDKINTLQGQNVEISVSRNSADASATTVSVAYEVIPGSAKQGEDYTPVTGTLTWQNNSTATQSFAIAIAADSSGTEFKESFFVRLFDPRNGATLSPPSYLTVNIDGITDSGAISFTQSELNVAENQSTFNVELSRDGSSQGEVAINYALESDSAIIGQDIEDANGTLTWLDGDSENKTITLTLINDENEELDESFTLLLEAVNDSRLGANTQLTVTISDDDANTAPTLTINENFQVNTGQTVTITAVGIDAEEDMITYLWIQDSGADVSLASPNEAETTFVAPSTAGQLFFTATATDNKGAQSSATVSITVVAPPEPVVAKSSSGGGSQSLWVPLLTLLVLTMRIKRKTLTS